MRRALVLLAIGLAASPAAALPTDFDGDWQVDARTTVGDCEPEIMATVHVQDGRVVASDAADADVAVWGYIEDGGAVSARFTQGPDMLRASGKLREKAGTGAWSSNTRYCGGTWTAWRAG